MKGDRTLWNRCWMHQFGMIHLLRIQGHTPQGFHISLRVDPR